MMSTSQSAVQLPADWRDFYALTKPRVISLVVFTGLCGLLAAPGAICLPLRLSVTRPAGGSAAR